MRMKFNKSSQLLLVSAASLLVAGLMTACETLTVDFVFVASSKAAGPNNYGELDVLEINSESGYMRHIPTSPFPSGGRNPVAEAVSSDNTNLFVVNQDDNTIVQFIIGNDGKLYPQNTTNTPGIYPLAVAVSGTNLFVLDTYQPLPTCSTAQPCSGSIGVFNITASSSSPPSDSIGTNPVANGSLDYWPLSLPSSPTDVLEPTALSVAQSGAFLYVAAYDLNTTKSYIFGYSVASSGVLTPLNSGAPLGTGAFATGSCPTAFINAPFVVGTCPSAMASATYTANSTASTYLYVTDAYLGQVHGYTVGSSGLLTELSGSPYKTGNQPLAIVADPNYQYAYVANAQDSTVTGYQVSGGTLMCNQVEIPAGALCSLGSVANSSGSGTYATGLQPVAMGIDPSTSHFLYTTNYLGSGVNGTVSGFELSPTDGTLVNSQKSPYTVDAQPTAIVAIPHNGTGAGLTK
jgi:DNA-binding beta-propeller fold protein YncE